MRIRIFWFCFATALTFSQLGNAEKLKGPAELTPMIISKGDHGGQKFSIEEHHFEVVFIEEGIMIYAKDDASDTIDAQKVRGFIQTASGPVALKFERKAKLQFFAANVVVANALFIGIDVLFTDGHGVGGRVPLAKKPSAGMPSAPMS
ncbi:MAG: hypothetical protein NW215_07355 [Hyphomicrobiales bacterium]|nr:hypothetical protein [Hyphomicrobiales bacterium]